MLEATFFSDTGQVLFEQDLQQRNVPFTHTSFSQVLIPDAPDWCAGLAKELGADVSDYQGELLWL